MKRPRIKLLATAATALALTSLVSLVLVVPQSTGAPAAARGTRPSIVVVEPGRGAIVVAGQGIIYLWDSRTNHIQVRNPGRGWGPVVKLPTEYSVEVAADGDKLLVLGALSPAGAETRSVVMLLDSAGAIADRWELERPVHSVTVAGGHRWAALWGRPTSPTRRFDVEKEPGEKTDALIELMPGGRIERREALEHGSRIAFIDNLGGRPSAGISVFCVREHPFKDGYRPAYCYATGGASWRRAGSWRETPLACGAHLVEYNYDPWGLPERRRKAELLVRRVADGEVEARRPVEKDAAVACGDVRELLIGAKTVRALSLPELAPLWDRRVAAGRVTALAHAGDEVLAALSNGRLMSLAARP